MMASSSTNPETSAETRSAPQDIPQPQQTQTQDAQPNPTPVEMTQIDSKAASTQQEGARRSSGSSPEFPHGPVRTDTRTALDQAQHPPSTSNPPPIPESGSTLRQRAFSTAIGPSSDQPVVPSKDGDSAGPALLITLLLTSGARHPFKLDNKYLQKRNVQVPSNDPFSLSVYKLKELILREWRDEWEQKPASPSSIRLISFGKLLDDKAPLKGICHWLH